MPQRLLHSIQGKPGKVLAVDDIVPVDLHNFVNLTADLKQNLDQTLASRQSAAAGTPAEEGTSLIVDRHSVVPSRYHRKMRVLDRN